MRQLHLTVQMLDDYYENRFQTDLSGFFEIVNNSEGAKTVKGGQRWPNILHPCLLTGILNANRFEMDSTHVSEDKYFCEENQFLFIALVSFMLSAEEELIWRASEAQTGKLHECLNDFGFPIVPAAADRYGLEYMLKCFKIDEELWSAEVVETLREVMKLVEPYMFSKFNSHLETWNNGCFANLLRNGIQDSISQNITEGLQAIYSRLYTYHGLTGIRISHRDFDDYYQHHFYDQFKRYFSCAEDKGGYLQVLYVYDQGNLRWADEMPGRNAKENLLFASILLYMVIAQQSILEHAPEVIRDFHKGYGWPMISSGPGGGPYLHPLKMLEYAGLSPQKDESLLFLGVVRQVFFYLRQEMNIILKNKHAVIKDPASAKHFIEVVKGQGHKCSMIKKYLTYQEQNVQELLVKWTTSSADCWYKMLESEGIPIMMEINKNKNWLTIEKEGQRVILKKCAAEAEGEVVIPEGVECISERAFQGCSSITSIIPPKSLKEIGNYAFMDCNLLKSFIFPEGLERIGDWAFYHTKIYDDSVSIPEGVELGVHPFEYPDVKDIHINTSVIDYCLNHGLLREVEEDDFVRDLSIAIPDWKEQTQQKYFWHVFWHRCGKAVPVLSIFEYLLKEKK